MPVRDPHRDALIIHMFLDDQLSQCEIGRRLGISGQRIGELLRRNGVDTYRICAERETVRHEETARRERERAREHRKAVAAKRNAKAEAKFAPWRELWDQGLTITEIAKCVGRKRATVVERIQHYRNTRGWFPLRVRSWKTGKPGRWVRTSVPTA